jgi:hypothetical protein
MASAGNLTLDYVPRTFTATVQAYPGFMAMSVQLTSPANANPPNANYNMASTSPLSNPSYWTYTFPPAPAPDPVQPGQVWVAVAVLQGIGTATGAHTI